jgi:hypothetical protein
MSTMKRELGSRLDSSADLLLSLSSATALLRWNEISRVDLNEALRLCESLKIDIQAKLASHAN